MHERKEGRKKCVRREEGIRCSNLFVRSEKRKGKKNWNHRNPFPFVMVCVCFACANRAANGTTDWICMLTGKKKRVPVLQTPSGKRNEAYGFLAKRENDWTVWRSSKSDWLILETRQFLEFFSKNGHRCSDRRLPPVYILTMSATSLMTQWFSFKKFSHERRKWIWSEKKTFSWWMNGHCSESKGKLSGSRGLNSKWGTDSWSFYQFVTHHQHESSDEFSEKFANRLSLQEFCHDFRGSMKQSGSTSCVHWRSTRRWGDGWWRRRCCHYYCLLCYLPPSFAAIMLSICVCVMCCCYDENGRQLLFSRFGSWAESDGVFLSHNVLMNSNSRRCLSLRFSQSRWSPQRFEDWWFTK